VKMDPKPIVIVTGASQGLGAATARCLASKKAIVCLVARSMPGLKAVEAQILNMGNRAQAIRADVANPEACRWVLNQALKHHGRVDALVNNAAVLGPLAYTAQADFQEWRHTLEVNLMGPFNLIQAALPSLRETAGRIVNVSSGAAVTALAGAGAYCVSKAALNHFTHVLAAEEPQIVAVAIRPGVVDTPMQATLRGPAQKVMPPEQAAYYRRLKADAKLEPPNVPARSIAWLALHAPAALSGRFVNYDDPSIAGPAKAWNHLC
jgi:NAD(P)-dependent dehydrogenase (short-subunit alcohol dehydrogenase family)